jgi:hypothetical protein
MGQSWARFSRPEKPGFFRPGPAREMLMSSRRSPVADGRLRGASIVVASRVELSRRRWGPRLAGSVACAAPRCRRDGAAHPFPGRRATTMRGRTREPRSGWARPRLTCGPAPNWASGRARGEARRPTKELWAAPMASNNMFLMMLQAYVLSL